MFSCICFFETALLKNEVASFDSQTRRFSAIKKRAAYATPF